MVQCDDGHAAPEQADSGYVRRMCAPGARGAARYEGTPAGGVRHVEDLLRPRLLAARLLRWWREREPDSRSVATPLDELVAALGLDVAAFAPELHPGTLGFLEPGEDLIFLRSGLGEAVRRFTLAHELGHAVLHRTSGNPAEIAGALAGPAPITATLDTCDTDDLEAPLDLTGISD